MQAYLLHFSASPSQIHRPNRNLLVLFVMGQSFSLLHTDATFLIVGGFVAICYLCLNSSFAELSSFTLCHCRCYQPNPPVITVVYAWDLFQLCHNESVLAILQQSYRGGLML